MSGKESPGAGPDRMAGLRLFGLSFWSKQPPPRRDISPERWILSPQPYRPLSFDTTVWNPLIAKNDPSQGFLR
jgi:hypothetical protein